MARSFSTSRVFSRFQKWKLVPRPRCSAMRTFSSTVRLGNTAEIWNERITPRRATSAGLSRVMSWPLKRIVPAVGCRNLVSRLKVVVLPAPLGPISAWIAPRRTLQVHVVDRDEPLELLREAARFEDGVAGHRELEGPALPRAGRCAGAMETVRECYSRTERPGKASEQGNLRRIRYLLPKCPVIRTLRRYARTRRA